MLSSETLNRQLDNTATETEVKNKHGIVQLEATSTTLSQNLHISLLILPTSYTSFGPVKNNRRAAKLSLNYHPF